MANFLMVTSDTNLTAFKTYRIGQINGATTPTFSSFYQAVAKALSFPDDFEPSMESLEAFLFDLEWIPQKEVALYITDTAHFLAQEKETKVIELLDVLDVTAEDWKWEDENPKNFKIILQESPKIVSLLEKEEMAFDRL
ncbi:MAG: barstar family protein [Spirosomataceae bacterium]